MMPIALPSESYYLDAAGASDQRLINMYAEPVAKESSIAYVLRATPGLTLLVDTEDGGPVRGIIQLRSGNTFFVSSGNCYLLTGSSAAVLGSIDPAGSLTLATDGENVIVCCNLRAFVYDGTSLTELTGTLPYVPQTVTWVEGFFVFTAAGSQIFYISNLNSATIYDPLDFATAQGSAGAILRCLESHLDLWLFSTDHIEIWYLSGAADFAFARQVGGIIEYGTAAVLSVANCDNSVFWLGNDRKVYRANGYSPQAVSSPAVERWLQNRSIDDCIGMQISLDGHNSYTLVFPTAAWTWAYDSTNNKWYERTSNQAGNGRWRANCSYLTNFNMMVGDSQAGRILVLDQSVTDENGAPIYFQVQFPALYGGGNPYYKVVSFPDDYGGGRKLFLSRLFLDFGTANQTILVQWSKDNGVTFNAGRTVELTSLRTFLTRLGSFRRIILRVSGTLAAPLALIDAQVDVTGGTA